MPNGINALLRNIFERRGQSLVHFTIPDGHVLDQNKQVVALPPSFDTGNDYLVVSLAEMFLKRTRVLWREFYPVVHSFMNYGNPQALKNVTTVAGPGQLKELGTANLDRLIGLSYTLAGPIVYDGQPVELLSGLYAVPAKDFAAIVIQTLSSLSTLVPTLAEATQVAGILKGGVEQLLGIEGTKLTVGLHQTFHPANSGEGAKARPGFVVAAYEAAEEVDPNRMWVIAGRLFYGADPIAAKPVEKYDYMLFQLFKGPSRVPTWATIPALAAHAAKFDEILRTAAKDKVKEELAQEFRGFDASLRASPDLTKTDQNAIRELVRQDLVERAEAIVSGNLFLTRSAAGEPEQVDPKEFRASRMDIPDDLAAVAAAGDVSAEQTKLFDD